MEFRIIAVLLFGYAIYYYFQMRKIQIASIHSVPRKILLILVGLVFFYLAYVRTASRPALIIIGSLCILVAFQNEGISSSEVIKFGVLNGEFTNYKSVLIHRQEKGCHLEFISPSRRLDTVLYFKENAEEMEVFFKHNSRKKILYRYALKEVDAKKDIHH